MSGLLHIWKARAKQLQTELYALYLAYKDPRVSWFARLFAAFVIGYALSPIDLIPDPIPVFGYLDDLILLPFGIWLALKLIPAEVMAESRVKAQAETAAGMPINRGAAVVIVIIWLSIAGFLLVWIYRWMR